jgi:hypothetical protein
MGFVLQQNSDLTTTNWSTDAITPMQTNALNQVVVSPSASNDFFRLKSP